MSYLEIIDIPKMNIKICKNEREMFINFFNIINNVKPDIITGFNDHSYDWLYIKNKIENQYVDLKKVMYKKMNILEKNTYIPENIIKPFVTLKVKISADIQPMEATDPNISKNI
jgi:DNA polymerase elongation subunit (family B)